MKSLISVILLITFFSPAFAQDTCSSTDKELKHGIQFQVGNMLTLTNFNGYTFSYRYRVNSKSGYRVSFYTSLNNEDYNIIEQMDTVINKPPTSLSNYNIKVSVQYLYSITSYKDFSLIIGGGPFISYRKYKSSSEYINYNYLLRTSTSNEKAFGFGLDLVSGINYQLFTNVILSGEYGLMLSKENTKLDYETIEQTVTGDRVHKENGDINSFSIRGSNVNLGITIYF